MLDDYLHVVDTVRWLSDGDLSVQYGNVHTNRKNQLIYVQHTYESSQKISFTTAMHRTAGSNLEQIEWLTDGAIIRVINMNTTEIEEGNALSTIVSWKQL